MSAVESKESMRNYLDMCHKRVSRLLERDPVLFYLNSMHLRGDISWLECLEVALVIKHEAVESLSEELVRMKMIHGEPLVIPMIEFDEEAFKKWLIYKKFKGED